MNQQPGTFLFVDDFIYQFLERSDNGGTCIYVRETFSSAGTGRFAFPARDVLQNLAARIRPAGGGGRTRTGAARRAGCPARHVSRYSLRRLRTPAHDVT